MEIRNQKISKIHSLGVKNLWDNPSYRIPYWR